MAWKPYLCLPTRSGGTGRHGPVRSTSVSSKERPGCAACSTAAAIWLVQVERRGKDRPACVQRTGTVVRLRPIGTGALFSLKRDLAIAIRHSDAGVAPGADRPVKMG